MVYALGTPPHPLGEYLHTMVPCAIRLTVPHRPILFLVSSPAHQPSSPLPPILPDLSSKADSVRATNQNLETENNILKEYIDNTVAKMQRDRAAAAQQQRARAATSVGMSTPVDGSAGSSGGPLIRPAGDQQQQLQQQQRRQTLPH
eukprot:TRINITY_DN14798_c0_g1_i2.p1 TRINITY_DN14798_c0_g1~~TRINITY_DN14798_c0_g1_i2.p1  ORF type:complete len:146 (+),score=19.05 TRINITY_DN14798_c0_g1_i2:208-645(+)